MKWYNDSKYVSKIPLLTTILFGYGAVCQMWRMWTTHTAAGQSIFGWVCVTLALMLFLQFYRIITPKEKIAFYSCLAEVFLYFGVIGSIIYFRW
jgi:hypothetical protein